MKRVLVTGATGFLGQHLCRALKNECEIVVEIVRDHVCERDHMQHEGRRAVVHGGFDAVERAISEYEIDTAFHLAAQTQVSTATADPTGTLRTNVEGIWRVLEACRRQKVARVIVASSDKVYGDGPSPYVEDQELRPHGIYATSKACADFLAQSYIKQYGMNIAITRCGNLYGPGHLNFSTLIPGTIRSALRGERPVIRSDGKAERDYLFVDDAVAGYMLLGRTSHVGAFNFGTGISTSVLEVVSTILSVSRSDRTPEIQGGAKDEIASQVLDSSKALNVLEWKAKQGLMSGLEKTIPWYRERALGGCV